MTDKNSQYHNIKTLFDRNHFYSQRLKTVMGVILFELLPFTFENLRFHLWQATVILAGMVPEKSKDFWVTAQTR